jgi:MoaA/NifB/PqqE/SkfB family radical SAM enzyme
MTLQEKIKELSSQYKIVAEVSLDSWHEMADYQTKTWFRKILAEIHKDTYEDNRRIIFTLTCGDRYNNVDSAGGAILTQLQKRLNEVDISNFFVILLTNDTTIPVAYSQIKDSISTDPVPISIIVYEETITEKIIAQSKKSDYNSTDPIKISLDTLESQEQFLLTKSKTFCMYPWIHMHAYPTGDAYLCCMTDMEFPIGNFKNNTMREIWNDQPMRKVRKAMLTEKSVDACTRCYEQEASGFMSGRLGANKHHGHHIKKVAKTQADGTFDDFELTYWDIRFSNLCNLSCRSCGHIFSSSWYQDQAKIAGPEWKKTHKVLNYAGRFETDAWEQLVEHIDHVEQIYFAGGEPLLMDEHYRILDELVRRKKFDVRLIYNTNFTHTELKDRSVFEYWKLFDSVAVGASLDDSGARGEYIRKGTDWAVVEQNRRDMLRICPEVDFYISPTLSIMNAWHLPDFHRDWVERGLINAQDINVNILQDPPHYRIDIAPAEYKEQLKAKFLNHIHWLQDRDPLQRATVGFESAVNYMMATDNTHLINTFWRKTHQLDDIRKEDILKIIPELAALK